MIEDCWRKKKYLFLFHLVPFPARSEASSDKNLLCKDLTMLFPSRNPRESPKNACSHEHPTLSQWAPELWRAESRSLLANKITANSLPPLYFPPLCTIPSSAAEAPIRSHSDCVCIYWQPLTFFVTYLTLFLSSCVTPSCCYLCSYLYNFCLILSSHSFLKLMLSSVLAQTPTFSLPLTTVSLHCLPEPELQSQSAVPQASFPQVYLGRASRHISHQSCSLSRLLTVVRWYMLPRGGWYCILRSCWISRKEENKA